MTEVVMLIPLMPNFARIVAKQSHWKIMPNFLQKDIYAGVHKSNTNFLQGCNQSSYSTYATDSIHMGQNLID